MPAASVIDAFALIFAFKYAAMLICLMLLPPFFDDYAADDAIFPRCLMLYFRFFYAD